MLTDPIVPQVLSGLAGGATLTVLVAAVRDKSRVLRPTPKPAADERPVPARRER